MNTECNGPAHTNAHIDYCGRCMAREQREAVTVAPTLRIEGEAIGLAANNPAYLEALTDALASDGGFVFTSEAVHK